MAFSVVYLCYIYSQRSCNALTLTFSRWLRCDEISQIIFCHLWKIIFTDIFIWKKKEEILCRSIYLCSRVHKSSVTMNNDKMEQMDRTNFEIYTSVYMVLILPKKTIPHLLSRPTLARLFVCSFVGVCMLFRNVNQFHVQQRTTKIVILIWAN